MWYMPGAKRDIPAVRIGERSELACTARRVLEIVLIGLARLGELLVQYLVVWA